MPVYGIADATGFLLILRANAGGDLSEAVCDQRRPVRGVFPRQPCRAFMLASRPYPAGVTH